MKLLTEHLSYLRKHLAPFDTLEKRIQYSTGNFPYADKVVDLDKRYRWDLLYEANLSKWICDNVYPYANDTHLDTALRSIVAPLPRKEISK